MYGRHIVFTDQHSIRRTYTDSSSGTYHVFTIAGGPVAGFSGDGGPASSARLNFASGVALYGADVFISDKSNSRIRKVTGSSGIITTVAGNGTRSFSGDGGPGTSASLWNPNGLAVDGGGNLLIADSGNHRIRRLAAGTGIITTVVGTGTSGFSGDGRPATSARVDTPFGVAVSAGGSIFISDTINNRIRMVAAGTGVISTIAGTATWCRDNSDASAPATSHQRLCGFPVRDHLG